jgi:adenosylcobyric acid synthase
MKTLMIQGTTSDAGKSVLTAGFCRIFSNLKKNVAPFKPQNMALNSAVTIDNGEIGRAQAMQALACRQQPRIDFNPILLKPNSDVGAQVIIHGHPIGELNAAEYHQYKTIAMNAVLESYERLSTEYDYLIVEGAGSPAEINLRDRDIANMGFAEAVDCPVILVADIDKGGVFAHLVGTLDLLSGSEQERVIGFVINKFRGDIKLLESGLDWLEQKTGKPVLGVLPYIPGLVLEAEDAIVQSGPVLQSKINIAVLVLSRISNHTDFDALAQHPEINLSFIGPSQLIGRVDLVIIPGSKSVRQDIAFLKHQGWDTAIKNHLRYGGKVLGICGGLQILGLAVDDCHGVEGEPGSSKGLGLLPLSTQLTKNKRLKRVKGTIEVFQSSVEIEGYEIRAGITHSTDDSVKRFSFLKDQYGEAYADGYISDDNQIIATYVHGVFDHPNALQSLLLWVNPHQQFEVFDVNVQREKSISRLCREMESHLNLFRINETLDQWYKK